MHGLKYIDLNTLGHGCVLYNVKSVTPNIRVDANAGSFVECVYTSHSSTSNESSRARPVMIQIAHLHDCIHIHKVA